ncbi:MAG TPA: thioesterase family protein, partial [Gaiellaceae bacterium]|nr:thioesterase family protein [Gaiellaceae bacterium]
AVFDDEIEVFVRVSRLGRTSVTFAFAAYRVPDDVLMVTAHQTLVYVDLAERKACPVPDPWREPVLAFEGDDVDA